MTPNVQMLKVLLTFDVEIWCGGWEDIDARFPASFQRYVYGKSKAGNFALPKTLEILSEHGLKGVFFVEPLFAARFGPEYLAEIVEMIQEAGQEIQLHLHPEWQDEARTPLIPNHSGKRQHLFMYSEAEQTALIGHGVRLLNDAGAKNITAFRAGSFACNSDTFVALKRNGISKDSSLNLSMDYSGRDLTFDQRQHGAHLVNDVMELPMSVSRSPGGGLRHVQIGACGYRELTQSLSLAREAGWKYFNVLSHNFEMLLPGTSRPDWVVARRFRALCEYLQQHKSIYPTVGFSEESFSTEQNDLPVPRMSWLPYVIRNVEQAGSRLAGTWAQLGSRT